MTARILTPWVRLPDNEDGEPGPWYPLVSREHGGGRWQDVTGQPARNIPPDRNAVVIQMEVDVGILDRIEADSRFRILWRDDIRARSSSLADEREAIEDWLRSEIGLRTPEVREALDGITGESSREQCADALRVWFGERPRSR